MKRFIRSHVPAQTSTVTATATQALETSARTTTLPAPPAAATETFGSVVLSYLKNPASWIAILSLFIIPGVAGYAASSAERSKSQENLENRIQAIAANTSSNTVTINEWRAAKEQSVADRAVLKTEIQNLKDGQQDLKAGQTKLQGGIDNITNFLMSRSK